MSAASRSRARWCAISLVALLLVPTAALAEGSVAGVVLDARTGLPVRGATLEFEGTDVTAGADLNGVFSASLEPGTYEVVVSAEGYQSQRITDVVVADGQTRNFSAILESVGGDDSGQGESGALVEEITVQAEAADATEAALLAERRSSSQIVDNIGAEEISKNTGSDAAGAVRRITGISLQEDKYVFVRGLGDRYSNTTLNGSRIPTVEFDKKVVPLDLFAADLLEKVTVAKSYSVDQPGDFVAGVVELETKNFPPRQRFSLGVSASDSSTVTGESTLEYPGGLGFSGSGGQGVPSGIPDVRLRRFNFFTGEGFTNEELEDFGELFVGEWSPASEDSAPYDQGLNFSYGNSFDRLGLVLSSTWSDDYTQREDVRNFFSIGTDGIRPKDSYVIDSGEETVKTSLMGNFALRLGDNSQIGLRALQTSLAVGEGRVQTGFLADAFTDIEDFVVRYQDQDVSSYQLSGDHFFSGIGGNGSLFEWKGSVSEAEVAENRREVLYEILDGERRLSDLSNSGFLFFNDQTDDLADYRADWSTLFAGAESYGSIKGGVALTDRDRDFDGRRFRFVAQRTFGLDLSVPPEDLYTPENIGSAFELREVTNATDGYTGNSEIAAGYIQADYSLSRWRFIGGVRYEDWDQEVFTLSRTAADTDPTVTMLAEQDILPAVSVVYDLGGNMAVRGSASQTVNRPDFRELAPFEFTQVVGGFNVIGNPDLVRAEIDSYDLRWEWFPSGGEVIAASVFYKEFTDPIESVVISAITETQTFQNNESAENWGFELEVRKRLGFIAEPLETVTAIVNYTFVESEIRVDPATTILTNPTRALTGQPDNVANVVLEWSPRRGNTAVRLLYNFIDDRIFLGGVRGVPDVFEEGRSTVDLAWRYSFERGISMKLSATNLLDEEKEWTQGGELWRSYEPGRSIGLSVGYSF